METDQEEGEGVEEEAEENSEEEEAEENSEEEEETNEEEVIIKSEAGIEVDKTGTGKKASKRR